MGHVRYQHWTQLPKRGRNYLYNVLRQLCQRFCHPFDIGFLCVKSTGAVQLCRHIVHDRQSGESFRLEKHLHWAVWLLNRSRPVLQLWRWWVRRGFQHQRLHQCKGSRQWYSRKWHKFWPRSSYLHRRWAQRWKKQVLSRCETKSRWLWLN